MLRTLLSRVLPGSDDGRDETGSDPDDTDADELESRARAAERERWRE